MSRQPLSHRRNAQVGVAAAVRRMARGSATGQSAQASPARPRIQATVLPAPAGGGAGVALDTLIKQGPAGVASNVFPAGTRVPAGFTSSGWFLRCNPSHTPSGSACTVAVKRSGSTVATVSISAGASSGTVATVVTFAAGDVLTYDITSAGSTTPAWDVLLQIVGA